MCWWWWGGVRIGIAVVIGVTMRCEIRVAVDHGVINAQLGGQDDLVVC
ncbi:hypothetical protein B398_09225 [Xylella fastidiosa 32]|nr:hypothetical protein B398_09225 [Xylella fastidiosa 32]